jgi:predicted flavoprotein YhiN
LSVPATGSDGIGLRLARELGHQINNLYPALTPLTADPPVHAELAGISLDVTITAPGHRPKFSSSGGFLFTHRGYSGPAVLDASHLAVRSSEIIKGGDMRVAPDGNPVRGDPRVAPQISIESETRQELTVQWSPLTRDDWERALMGGRGRVERLVAREVPLRLATRLLEEAGVPAETRAAELSRDGRKRLVRLLTAYPLPWTGHAGYQKGEVTGGGVSLAEVDPQTLGSRRCHGLFLCGEILDSFGPIGGHNFMWAWSTGRAAGVGAAAVAAADDGR